MVSRCRGEYVIRYGGRAGYCNSLIVKWRLWVVVPVAGVFRLSLECFRSVYEGVVLLVLPGYGKGGRRFVISSKLFQGGSKSRGMKYDAIKMGIDLEK